MSIGRRGFLKVLGIGGAAASVGVFPEFEGFASDRDKDFKKEPSSLVAVDRHVEHTATGLTFLEPDVFPDKSFEGSCFFDTSEDCLLVYDGEKWCKMTSTIEKHVSQ